MVRRKGITAVDSESQEPSQIAAAEGTLPETTETEPTSTTPTASPSEGGARGRKPKGGTKKAAPRGGAKSKAAESVEPPPKATVSSPAFDWNETQDEKEGEGDPAEKNAEGNADESEPKQGEAGSGKGGATGDGEQGGKADVAGGVLEANEDGEEDEDTRPTVSIAF